MAAEAKGLEVCEGAKPWEVLGYCCIVVLDGVVELGPKTEGCAAGLAKKELAVGVGAKTLEGWAGGRP